MFEEIRSLSHFKMYMARRVLNLLQVELLKFTQNMEAKFMS